MSYDAGDAGGTLLTKPFRYDGARTLHLNANAAAGTIRVEAVNVERDTAAQLEDWQRKYGNVLAGFDAASCEPFTGDSTAATVRWPHGPGLPDLSCAADRFIALRFHMRNASIYSWWLAHR